MKIAFISSPCAAGQPPLRDFEMKARKTTMSVRALRKPFARAFAECSHTQKQSTTSSEVLDATSEFSKIALKHFSGDAKAVDNKFRGVGIDFRMFPNCTGGFFGLCQSGRQNIRSDVAQLPLMFKLICKVLRATLLGKLSEKTHCGKLRKPN